MFGKQNLIFNFFLLSLAWCKSSTDASNLRYPGEDFSKADLQLAENDLDATKPLASVSGYIHQLLGDLKAIKMPTGSDGFAKSEHGLPEDVMMALNRLSEITDTDDEAEALLLFEELPKALEAMANYAENASGLDEEVAFSFASIAKGLRNAKQATDVAARNVPKLFNALPANTKKENIPTPTTTATFAEPAQVARKMVEVDFNGNTRNSGEGHSSSRRRRTSSSNSRFRSDPYAQYRNQHPRFKHHYDLQDAMLNGDHRFLTEHLTKMQHHAGQHTNPATGRKLFNNDFESLESQCSLLYDCVKLMSFYDLIVYFYA